MVLAEAWVQLYRASWTIGIIFHHFLEIFWFDGQFIVPTIIVYWGFGEIASLSQYVITSR